MKHYIVLLIIFLICGCNRKPSDVPPLYPCQVVVKNGAAPITDVEVILGLTDVTSMCSMLGTTDSAGIAIIKTSRLDWQGNGAPAGEYIVTISKAPKFEGELSLEEFQKLDPAAQELYNADQARKHAALPREVPIQYSDFASSPYRMTVAKEGENRLEIDIAQKP
jgi:hypothetical protein